MGERIACGSKKGGIHIWDAASAAAFHFFQDGVRLNDFKKHMNDRELHRVGLSAGHSSEHRISSAESGQLLQCQRI